MKDYKFGNLMCKLRTQANMTQKDLARNLGISNKAISKWENGVAKPTTNTLKKLSLIFNIPIENLLNVKEENNKKITKIVITGGPCAGKTTAMSWIQNAFTKLGYNVLFVSETATELIKGGIAPWTCSSNANFQENLLKLQIEKEKIYESAAKSLKGDKVLIVCDRGTLDNKAYMSELEFYNSLNSIGSNEIELRDNYDAVFHLVTAAKDAKDFYTLENNSARTETIDEAIIQDDKLINAWTGHPHFRVIDNSTDFEKKMLKLISEITNFLGEPTPFEIERKFLIEYPNIKWLENIKNCQRIEIMQTYLKSDTDDEIRVRQRGINGNYVYFKTIKKNINNIKRIEIEERLSKDEYLDLLMNADTNKKPIRKTRYCITYKNQYFEVDIFPFWKDKAILEIELSNENDKIDFPKKFKIIKEVTNDEKYKNSSLANL